jgi:4-methylaminobutanoate oxidase (formaldehyde-forming)
MEIGRMAGVRIPAVAVEHQYVLTGPIPDFSPAELRQMPTMRDPDLLVYYKPDGPGLLIGGYEPDTVPFGLDGVPASFQRQLLDPNFDRFEQLATLAAQRTPVIEQAGIRTMINGPIPYSADADFVMGKVPELDNYFVATGFLYGIAAGGGAGKMMAEWILEGRTVARSVAARCAPLRVPPHDSSLHGLANGRAVRTPLQAGRAGHRAHHLAGRETQSTA